MFFTGISHTSQMQGSNSSAVISNTRNLQFETFSASPDCIETDSSLSSGSLESKTLQAPIIAQMGRNHSFHLHLRIQMHCHLLVLWHCILNFMFHWVVPYRQNGSLIILENIWLSFQTSFKDVSIPRYVVIWRDVFSGLVLSFTSFRWLNGIESLQEFSQGMVLDDSLKQNELFEYLNK